jgi:hypothetical protein
VQTAFNEASPIPNRIDCTALVDERCDRSLNATTPGLLNPKIRNTGANRPWHSAVQLPDRGDLTAILVAARNIEEQVGCGGDAKARESAEETRSTR